MVIATIGLDLAKNVFQVHGVDERGATVLRKQLKRDQVLAFFVQLQPCLIGIEACGGAHYWAAKLIELGHQVKMMAPQFVKPYVKTNKNDSLDAEAICEAVARPNMRFVPLKSPEQQAVLSLHTARESFVQARTAQANQIRGLLLEFGSCLESASAAMSIFEPCSFTAVAPWSNSREQDQSARTLGWVSSCVGDTTTLRPLRRPTRTRALPGHC